VDRLLAVPGENGRDVPIAVEDADDVDGPFVGVIDYEI
jgi:hypothetical protein